MKKPLIRTGERGEQVFKEASWDVALDHIADKLVGIRDKYGPEAVALFSHGFGGSWFKHLLQAYGTNNIAAPSYAQCRGPREVGYFFLGGIAAGIMIFSALLALRRSTSDRSSWSRWVAFLTPGLLSIGMFVLLLDLEYKFHVWRFYAAFEITSPMSWGSWILLLIYCGRSLQPKSPNGAALAS